VVEIIYPKFGELYPANFIDSELLEYLKSKGIITTQKLAGENLEVVDLSNYCGYLGRDFKKLAIPRKLLPVLGVSEGDSSERIAEAFNSYFDKFFRWILEKLAELSLFELSLSSYDATEDFGEEKDIYKFFLLLNFKEELIEALEIILHRPHRVLEIEEVLKPVSEVCEVDGAILEEALCHPERWVKNEGKCLPTELIQPQYIEGFDSPENRFVKAFLVEILDFIEKLDRELRSMLWEIEDITFFALNSDVFAGLELQSSPPTYSQVLQKRPGYRELFQFWTLYYSSFIPQWFEGLKIAFGLRSISTLWEYYVLVRLLELLEKELGSYKIEQSKNHLNKDYEEITIKFVDGSKLYYQRKIKSYSNSEWRPDFLLEFEGRRIIFDAKFRDFKRNKTDILQNMHYYKDGLRANWAVALTFGTVLEGQLYSCKGNLREAQTLKDLLALLEDEGGVGYLELYPMEVI